MRESMAEPSYGVLLQNSAYEVSVYYRIQANERFFSSRSIRGEQFGERF